MPGQKIQVDTLADQFLTRKRTRFEYDENPHNVASTVKKLIRNIPDALLTYQLYEQFVSVWRLPSRDAQVHYLQLLLEKLPDLHKHVLAMLTYHLSLVVKHSVLNKMSAHNLAIVFGPTLLRTESVTTANITNLEAGSYVVELIISHGAHLFTEPHQLDLSAIEDLDVVNVDPRSQFGLLYGGIEWLNANCRLSGSVYPSLDALTLQQTRECFQANEQQDFTELEPSESNFRHVAAFFCTYLSDMPEPLIPESIQVGLCFRECWPCNRMSSDKTSGKSFLEKRHRVQVGAICSRGKRGQRQ